MNAAPSCLARARSEARRPRERGPSTFPVACAACGPGCQVRRLRWLGDAAGVRRRRGGQGAHRGPYGRRRVRRLPPGQGQRIGTGRGGVPQHLPEQRPEPDRAGKAQYTLCVDDATGGVIDDLIAYLHGPDEVFLIPNAANTAEVSRRLAAAAPLGVTVTDRHEGYAVLAVQGPRS